MSTNLHLHTDDQRDDLTLLDDVQQRLRNSRGKIARMFELIDRIEATGNVEDVEHIRSFADALDEDVALLEKRFGNLLADQES